MNERNHDFQKAGLSEDQRAFHVARRRMVEQQLRPHGIVDERVLDAMAKVPRHCFVDEGLWDQAYSDRPLPIGEGQTISQPLMVASMTQALALTGSERVLEIGSGCGFQTSILCTLAREVYSIERIARLSHLARRHLYGLGYMNFHLRIGDGTLGWAEAAPFDAIMVTAGAPSTPPALLKQLGAGGRAILPVGTESGQELRMYTRTADRLEEKRLEACRFVKLIGAQGWGA